MKDQPDTTNNDAPKAPVSAEAPVATPPPTQAWTQTPPAATQVQYVVAQKSLDGIGGWLMVFLIIFGLLGLAYITVFFTSLGQSINTPTETVGVIFSPILAVGFLGSVVLIALRKKLAIYASMATIGALTVLNVITAIIKASNGSSSETVGVTIGSVVVTVIFGGLLALYFYSSKRVKATLVSK